MLQTAGWHHSLIISAIPTDGSLRLDDFAFFERLSMALFLRTTACAYCDDSVPRQAGLKSWQVPANCAARQSGKSLRRGH
jgi:hypothetical protein